MVYFREEALTVKSSKMRKVLAPKCNQPTEASLFCWCHKYINRKQADTVKTTSGVKESTLYRIVSEN